MICLVRNDQILFSNVRCDSTGMCITACSDLQPVLGRTTSFCPNSGGPSLLITASHSRDAGWQEPYRQGWLCAVWWCGVDSCCRSQAGRLSHTFPVNAVPGSASHLQGLIRSAHEYEGRSGGRLTCPVLCIICQPVNQRTLPVRCGV
jgi:hypothetical protein